MEPLSPVRRSRRRATVFLCSFIPALAISLTYVYLRPAEYRAMARLQIAPAGVVSQPTEAKDTPTITADARSFLTEVQVLTSRPLLQDTVNRLKNDGALPDLGSDPVEAIQRMLYAEPVAGTQIVELSAEGRQPQFVPRLVNTVVDAYQQHVHEVYIGQASTSDTEISNEVSALEAQVTTRRQAIDAFSTRYDIVSMEHNENDVLANIEGLSRSYTDATGRLAKAQANLETLRKAAASGNSVVRAKDDPAIADLTSRVSQLREQWREQQGRFTPQYLARDPNSIALKTRLDNLEEQLAMQRTVSAREALAEAQEEVSAAQGSVEQLKHDVATNQQQAREFATHLNEYKTLREDLDHFEGMHRAAVDRLTKQQATEQERAPHVELVEAAAPSLAPWWPNYQRDALIAAVGSLFFALFATWFADFIAGPAAPPGMLVQHVVTPGAMLGRDLGTAPLTLGGRVAEQLPPPDRPRELADDEIAILLGAAKRDAQLASVALLMGLSPEELVALRWDEIDLSAGVIRLSGESARSIALREPLQLLLAACKRSQPGDAGSVFHNARGDSLDLAAVDRFVIHAAFDAGLVRAQEVTAATLRSTYLCYLIRQGIRASDIADVAGSVPDKELLTYMENELPRERRPLEQIDFVLPALRRLAADGGW